MRFVFALFALLLIGCATGPRPAVRQPKAAPAPLRIQAQANPRYVKANAASELVARLRISTRADLEQSRGPVNLALVIDTSGSMEGKAIQHARKAAHTLVASLRDGDRVAIVVFSSEAKVLVPSVVVGRAARTKIAEQIQSIVARGTTALARGLSLGLSQVGRARVAGSVNRIVLLSDGIPNDPRYVLGYARSAQAQQITITALGLGLDYDETLLGSIARTSGGSFHFVEDPARVAEVFREEVVQMREVVAQNLTLRLVTGPGIEIQRIYGRPVRQYGRAAHVPLGALRRGETRDVLVRLRVPARRAGAVLELLDARLTYAVVEGASRRGAQSTAYLGARATADAGKLQAGHDRELDLVVARAEAAQATIDAIALARARRLKEAYARVDAAHAAALAAAKTFDDGELAATCRRLRKLRQALPSLVQRVVRSRGPIRGPRSTSRPRPQAKAPAPVPESAPRDIRRAHYRAMMQLH